METLKKTCWSITPPFAEQSQLSPLPGYPRTGMLLKVQRFERMLNRVYNWIICTILGYELYDRKLVLSNYWVDKKAMLYVVTGLW
jgi:hypothetical protein